MSHACPLSLGDDAKRTQTRQTPETVDQIEKKDDLAGKVREVREPGCGEIEVRLSATQCATTRVRGPIPRRMQACAIICLSLKAHHSAVGQVNNVARTNFCT
jgi:hypothetical protein